MTSFSLIIGFLLGFSNVLSALPFSPSSSIKSPIQTVYEFPNETWVENIAVRPSGQLLVTLITTPDLYQIDPFSSAPAILVHSFPQATSTLGIAEIQPDVFAVVNWSTTTFSTTNGSYSIWKVDLRQFNGISTKPAVLKIADIHEASYLNGLTLLSPLSSYLLIADSGLGVVWRLNYLTGDYKIVLDNPLFKPVPGQLMIGINGIHTRNNSLYFTNSFQKLFGRVPISPLGTATSEYDVITYNRVGDNFTFDKEGNAYITQDTSDALEQVTPEGKVTILAGGLNSTVVEGDTAAAFGRTERDKETLYITTNGGIARLVARTRVVGGKVLAIDLPALLA